MTDLIAHCHDCNCPKECTALGRCYFRPAAVEAIDRDDDMFDDEPERIDHQAARLDHARDLRKHG